MTRALPSGVSKSARRLANPPDEGDDENVADVGPGVCVTIERGIPDGQRGHNPYNSLETEAEAEARSAPERSREVNAQ
jgi:hypothetical protein